MLAEAVDEQNEAFADLTLEHLEEVCRSPHFVTSPRCQGFLRYIVTETIEGRGEQIKERNIAHEVFGKGDDFEPVESSLVRVKAGEVRKRLNDYYELSPDTSIRFELPLGRYIPRIHHAQEKKSAPEVGAAGASLLPAHSHAAPTSVHRRRLLLGLGAFGAIGVCTVGAIEWMHKPASLLDRLWRPIFAGKTSLLIFIPVMRKDDGALSEWVGMGPAAALGRASDFLSRHGQTYRLRFGSDLTFSDLREQPCLMLGGFYSEWTERMTKGLPIAPLPTETGTKRAFMDSQTKEVWTPKISATEPYVNEDYGILCRVFDESTRQIIMFAVGTQTFGTEGAANLLFDPLMFAEAMKTAPTDWEKKNFEILVKVTVIGTTPSSPHFVKARFW